MTPQYQDFLSLNKKEQKGVISFFDHFSNRVLQYSKNPENKINLPFTFHSVDDWKNIF